jgi:hypothetical protein
MFIPGTTGSPVPGSTVVSEQEVSATITCHQLTTISLRV